MITKLLLLQNKRANDAQGGKGRGKQLGSESRCILRTVAPRRLDFSISCACSKRMPWLQCVFSLLYLWGPLGTACRDNKLRGKQAGIRTGCHSRWAEGQQGSQLASHSINCRQRHIVWHPRAHPAICDCKSSTALLGPDAPLLPQLPGTRGTQVATAPPHLRHLSNPLQAPSKSYESSQSSWGCSSIARVFVWEDSEEEVSRSGT